MQERPCTNLLEDFVQNRHGLSFVNIVMDCLWQKVLDCLDGKCRGPLYLYFVQCSPHDYILFHLRQGLNKRIRLFPTSAGLQYIQVQYPQLNNAPVPQVALILDHILAFQYLQKISPNDDQSTYLGTIFFRWIDETKNHQNRENEDKLAHSIPLEYRL